MVAEGHSFSLLQEEDERAKHQRRPALKERRKRTTRRRMMMTTTTIKTRVTKQKRRASPLEVEEQTDQAAEGDGVEGGDVGEEEVVRNRR